MTLVIFSDSVGAGQHVSPHLGWVHRVSAALPDVLVVNASRTGDTTRTALERMAHDVPLCDVLYVQFGLNDANIWASEFGTVRVSEEAFVANLTEIAGRARGARVVYGTNHRTRRSPEYDVRARRYNDLIRYVARQVDAELVDMECLDVHLLDKVHPSVSGHVTYADRLLPVMRRLLPAEAVA